MTNVFRSLRRLRRGVRPVLGLPKGEDGFSMVEALMALGIGAVGWMAIVQLSESNMRLQKANSLTIDRDTLRATIMAKLHCPNSVSQTFVDACKAGKPGYVALIDKNKQVFVAADGTTRFGTYNVRASCSKDALDIRIASFKPDAKLQAADYNFDGQSSHFSPDPVTRVAVGWTHAKSMLFPQGGLGPCSELFGKGAAGDPIGDAINAKLASIKCAPGQYLEGFDAGAKGICKNLPVPQASPPPPPTQTSVVTCRSDAGAQQTVALNSSGVGKITAPSGGSVWVVKWPNGPFLNCYFGTQTGDFSNNSTCRNEAGTLGNANKPPNGNGRYLSCW